MGGCGRRERNQDKENENKKVKRERTLEMREIKGDEIEKLFFLM